MKKQMNQTEYARHRGISQQRVSYLIKFGYLKGSLTTQGNRKLIDPIEADKLLEQNQGPGNPSLAQRKAHAWAFKGAGKREAIWETLRYLTKLNELDPKSIKIIFPEPGQTSIIFEYQSYDHDCGLTHERLLVDSLFEE
ncbi:MAG: hypothetical protein KKE12_17740 [Proteobacteria bacterium]|nr:hypothetical protein [Pseudomonadota bacterium]